MSGDVQPRKRKDKKKKKDDIGVEEPRGTAAALGEGDLFLHSHQDHGTGGHWCAKIIFFSLLAVLITLIGLIILENRGLSDLEANAVESRYSGVLEGWLEDTTEDDHHDAHTLELKHHDDDDEEHGHDDDEHQIDHGDDEEDEEHDDDYDHNEDDDHGDDKDEENAYNDHYEDEQNQEDEDGNDPDGNDDDENYQQEEDRNVDAADVEEEEVGSLRKFFGFGYGNEDGDKESTESKPFKEENDENSDEIKNDAVDSDDAEENEDDEDLNEKDYLNTEDEEDINKSFDDDDKTDDDDDNDFLNDYNEKDEDNDHDIDDDEENTEVERIEREVSHEELISIDRPALPEDRDGDDDKDQDQDDDDNEKQDDDSDEDDDDPDDSDKDDDFLEADDEPLIERITAPSGRPFDELEDEEVSTEKPPDTLKEEEEYEKKQEELRREQEQSSHMWLKLVVGVALLAATHAVMRRATAPSDETESDEHVSREETPVVDRRMTLIPVPEEPLEPEVTQKASRSKAVEDIVKKTTIVFKHVPPPREESDEDQEAEEVEMKEEEKELFSEEESENDPEQEDEIVQARKETPKQGVPTVHEITLDDEVGDDVEIIDDDQLEEELENEEEDEEISDVDDAELLTRLEAKYGRLPEPDRPSPKHSKLGWMQDGGNSIEDEWPGEPSDPYWRQQLDSAERHLRQGEYAAATRVVSAPQLADSARARWLIARALDLEAEARRDNRILTRAIAAYINLLKMNERLSDKKLLEIANRTLERIQFRGNYLSAEPVYRLLIRRFPDDVTYRNKLTVSYLMANKPDLANQVLKETLSIWPNDRVALAHYGFVLKTQHNKLEDAVAAFQKALEGDQGPACEPRFYYHLGDALLLLGRFSEAHEVHKRAAMFGHFLSPAQRSLYNVPRLKGKPWWNVEDTPYVKLARSLETSWREILKEGLAAQALYENEKEGLKDRGDWSQLDLFVRGQEIPGRCKQAPVTCSVVKAEAAAVGCRRGQIKFSAMEPGTHVRPHVGPTNCRLRMHLGLSNTKDTYLRVDQETRQWQEGKVLLFDDSFEHEVWHNGTGKRLVLIVDVWHHDLTPAERRQLPAI